VVWVVVGGLLAAIPVWVLASRFFQQWFRQFEVDARSRENEVELTVTNPGAFDHLVAEVIAVMGTSERVSVPYVIPLDNPAAEIPHRSTRVLTLASARLLSVEQNSLGVNEQRYGAFSLAGASPTVVHLSGVRTLDALYEHEIILTVRITGKTTGRRRDFVMAVGFDAITGHARYRVPHSTPGGVPC
jgi:hypothetical protein